MNNVFKDEDVSDSNLTPDNTLLHCVESDKENEDESELSLELLRMIEEEERVMGSCRDVKRLTSSPYGSLLR